MTPDKKELQSKQVSIKDIMPEDWDWFGHEKNKEKYGFWISKYLKIGHALGGETYSLADLLSNKSWCESVWYEECGYGTCTACCPRCEDTEIDPHADFWKEHSIKAFSILQQEGEQACINYIYQTKK